MFEWMVVALLAMASPANAITTTFDITVTVAPQSPGPSSQLYTNNPYYSCTSNKFVATTGNAGNTGNSVGSPWDITTASNYAAPAGTCINVAVGVYSVGQGVTIANGGTSSTTTGYVVWRCSTMPFSFSGGALQGEGTGCVIKNTNGSQITGAAFSFNASVSYVMFDGFELNGNTNQANVCLDVENPGSTAGTNHHIWVMNSDMHHCGQSGLQWNYTDWLFIIHNVWHDNSSVSGFDGSGLSIFEPAGITYTPTPGNPDYWFSTVLNRRYNIVIAYNYGYHNYNHFSMATDGEGIILDSFNSCNNSGSGTTCPYNGNVLVLGNVMYGNGGEGFEILGSGPGRIDVINNTWYSNGWDGDINGTFGTAQGYGETAQRVTWWNNIGLSVTGGSSKGCDADGATTSCTFRDSDGTTGTSTWNNNMAYPANLRSFENTPSGTYPVIGPNCNTDGTNPSLTTLNAITAATGGGSTGNSNFVPQAGSPAISSGQYFDLWQQVPGQVDIGACPSFLTSCP